MTPSESSNKLTAAMLDPERRRNWLSLDNILRVIPFILLAIVLVYLAFSAPKFYTGRNIINIFVQASSLGVMAIGVTFVLIGGGIDLSIPAVMALSAIMGAMHLRDGGSLIVTFLIMLVTGSLLGCINGFAVAYMKMIPFVVTLAMMTIATGTSIWVTNSVSIPVYSEELFDIVLGKTLGIPHPVILMVIAAIVAAIIIRKSLLGRWLYAVGVNVEAARVSGIPTTRVLFSTYVASGFFAGLTAIVLSARLGSASANMGSDGVVLDIISSAVVGGVSIYGGVGGPIGAVLGAIFITVISNSMNMLQVSFFTSLMIKGVVIIAFVALDSLRRR
jgi:ribose/xylose/arabinose/galactoside ABC-type transport system permease subunit